MVVDCADLNRSAAFWSGVLGYVAQPGGGDRYRSLKPAAGSGVEVLLQRVPEAKSGKNRLHLDLRVTDLHAEVARVEGFGAGRLTATPLSEDGWSWHVLTDPDGNEFCVITGP
ncbi:putative enzyme related to lactoylglutathione lyase [Actinoplanes lutulentus]|uniref:Putative enzyme related to lactoylglutathione lyase n=1 Tax=Actinoplanes lutulentus TaxID=1287878 RepID=A0A327Z8L6_9ACTN|nr:putative enzyme related to lactoylglutathione lyase [Actinoplanes lutulentus]